MFPLCRCESLALLRPLRKFRNHCKWTMSMVEGMLRVKGDNVLECQSTLDLQKCRVQLMDPGKHPHTDAHICIALPLCEGIKETFKERQRDWLGAQGPSPLPLERPGQIKTARASPPALLPPPLSVLCIRTLENPTQRSLMQPGGLGRRLFYNDVRDLGGLGPQCMCMCVD